MEAGQERDRRTDGQVEKVRSVMEGRLVETE